jgi:1-acyl-sn-glycerol-3-phosphate acyltransferase
LNLKLLLRPLQILYNLYAILLFVVQMLLVFPFIIVASFLGPYRSGNAIFRLCSLWGDCWFPMLFIWHKNIYEAPIDKTKAHIFVANHVSYLDAALLVKVFRLPIRALGKVEIGKVPLFGYIYRKVIITVDRGSLRNRAQSIQKLKEALRKNISVLVFPEGTFNETGQPLKSFYDGAFRIAIETGTPISPVLLLDAWSRMPPGKAFTLNPGRCRAVFLEEVPVAGLTLADTAMLKDKVAAIMAAKLRQYEAAWIEPGTETQ